MPNDSQTITLRLNSPPNKGDLPSHLRVDNLPDSLLLVLLSTLCRVPGAVSVVREEAGPTTAAETTPGDAEDPELTKAGLKDEFTELVRMLRSRDIEPTIAYHGGRGVMLEFSSDNPLCRNDRDTHALSLCVGKLAALGVRVNLKPRAAVEVDFG